MKFQDKHREFYIKCYAKFMNTNATINAFKSVLGQELYTPIGAAVMDLIIPFPNI